MHLQRVKYKDIEQFPQIQLNKNFKKDFQGSSPSLFIGKDNYPNVNVGFLSPQFGGDTSHYDSPRLWSRGKFGIGQVANMRYGLVNSRQQQNIKDVHTQNRFMDIIKEVGMASKAVELEVNLKNQPKLHLRSEKEIIPFGPQSELLKARVTSNPKVDSRVERVVSDTDLKSVYALTDLYRKGFEESFLSKLLSSSNLGLKQNRKLVPTRWSITAVDDTLGKQLIAEVKDLSIGDYSCYFGGEWGNYYLILFFPEIWSYELFEMYVSYKVNPWSQEGNFYSTDYENYNGRKSYAEECAGGYYAARISVLEKMKELKRQQSALVLRFTTSEYNIPLGVWVCREASRKSVKEHPISFASKELMLKYATEIVRRKFGIDLNELLKESRLLKAHAQKKIGDFY